MKYTTKAAAKSTVKITIKFDAQEWKDAQYNAYLKTRGRFAINGFRKGKAPKNVIENVYGKGVFYEDALNTLFGDNYGKILDKEEKKFTAVGDPDVSVDVLFFYIPHISGNIEYFSFSYFTKNNTFWVVANGRISFFFMVE